MNSSKKMLQAIPEDAEVLVLQVQRAHSRMPFLGEFKSVSLSYSGMSEGKEEFKGVLFSQKFFGWLLNKEEEAINRAEETAKELYRHYLFKGVRVIVEGIRGFHLGKNDRLQTGAFPET